jgi:hypothetical protein
MGDMQVLHKQHRSLKTSVARKRCRQVICRSDGAGCFKNQCKNKNRMEAE